MHDVPHVQFVETSIFTRRITSLLTPDAYAALQRALAAHPEAGALMRGTGGARKLRWALKGSGKSGGVRVVYYFAPASRRCYMLFAFSKNEAANLTQAQRNALRDHIQRNLK